MTRFLSLQARFRAWMIGDALPMWCSVGRDEPGMGFREQLALDGTPEPVPFKRMRVQARQIYAYSHAAVLGWPGGMEAAADAYGFILRHGRRGDAWVRTLGPRGEVLDGAADLYDLAFVLFALAWYARATGEAEPLAHARRTTEWVRGHMAHPAGGFHNTAPLEPGHRLQNPHMHLLEASLALWEASEDGFYADLAHELVSLFRNRLHHPETRTLGEYFDDELLPIPGETGDLLEPGHHYEWTWLLDRYAALFGAGVTDDMHVLYGWAEMHGRSPGSPAVLDVVGRDGQVRRETARLWCQTEALKAHVAMHRRGHDAASSRLEDTLAHVLDQYFTGCPRGTWRDQLDPHGRNVARWIPASSFYHIFLAYAELETLANLSSVAGLKSNPAA